MNTREKCRRALENVQRCRKQLSRAERELSRAVLEAVRDRDVMLEIEVEVAKLAARTADNGD